MLVVFRYSLGDKVRVKIEGNWIEGIIDKAIFSSGIKFYTLKNKRYNNYWIRECRLEGVKQ